MTGASAARAGLSTSNSARRPKNCSADNLKTCAGTECLGVHARLDRNAGRRRVLRACLFPLRQRNQPVLVLDPVDRGIVLLVGGVGPPAEGGEAGVDAKLGQLDGQRALEVGADEGEVSALVAMGAGPGCRRDVVPGIDDLHQPPALAFHRRYRQHHRLDAQVEVCQRIQRIHVHADDLVVRRVGKLAVVVELVERARAPLPAWPRWSWCRPAGRCRQGAGRR